MTAYLCCKKLEEMSVDLLRWRVAERGELWGDERGGRAIGVGGLLQRRNGSIRHAVAESPVELNAKRGSERWSRSELERVSLLPNRYISSLRLRFSYRMAMPANYRHVYPIEELREAVEQPPPSRDWSSFASSAIVLDNGASTMRAGWSTEKSPRVVSENVVAKYKDRKTNHNMLLAGSEAYADATSRGAVKSPFEGDVLVNFDQMVRRALPPSSS